MIAASVWSLLIPSIEMAKEKGMPTWIPATVGFLLGIFFLMVLDKIIPHMHIEAKLPEGPKTKLRKTTMMVLAVTLHNIPERYGSWGNICRCHCRKYGSNYGRSIYFSIWNRNTKLP